jgi:hypothetical protein
MKNIRVSCKNNVIIVLVQELSGMLLDRFVVLIAEPDGERFAVLDMRTFANYKDALLYVDEEQTEHNLDEAAIGDWYNGGRVL